VGLLKLFNNLKKGGIKEMTVKNYCKLIDLDNKVNNLIKVVTWNSFNGFEFWDINDKEIQNAVVQNVVVYHSATTIGNIEINIQAQRIR